MGDRSGTEAGLVGEHAALDAPGDDQDHGANDTTGDTAGGESTLEDVVEHGGQGVGIANDHDQAGQDVDDCHDGHQLLGDSAQALDAAEQNHGGQDDQDDAQDDVDQGLLVKVGVEGGDHGVDGRGDVAHLHGVADAEGCQGRKDTEDSTQPLPVLAEAVLDVIHGAADPVAVLVAFTEPDGQQDLGVLGRHADQGGDPQPEHGTRAAQRDGGGDTGDVTGTDGTSQRRTHGLEGRHFAFLGFGLGEDLAQGVLHGVAELTELHAEGPDGQQDTGTHQEDEHGDAPHDAVDGTVDGLNDCHTDLSFSRFALFLFATNPSETDKHKRSATRPWCSVKKRSLIGPAAPWNVYSLQSPKKDLSFCLRVWSCPFGPRVHADVSRLSSSPGGVNLCAICWKST